MKVYDNTSAIDPALRGAVLSVGNFDGVHLGHQRILRTARALAHVSSAAVIAMTFEPHPITLLRPGQAPPRLTPWEEKARQLAGAGADAIVKLHTDWSLLSLSAEDFIRDILIRQIHPSYIVEGPNFGFGRDRAGNIETLRQASPRGGFQVHEVEPYRLHLAEGQVLVVSSTAIRAALSGGDVALAMKCLGRPYALVGTVVHGASEGRKLGYPTINLAAGDQLIPGEGVYAGLADFEDEHHVAAVSIGHRPTLGGTSLVVEAFLLEASGDYYGRRVRLGLIGRVRDQRRFDDREGLTAQIGRDIEEIGRMVKEYQAGAEARAQSLEEQ